MSDEAFRQTGIDTLAAKLNAMDLTDEERTMLQAVFRAAAEGAEVEGFMQVTIGQVSPTVTPPSDGFPLGQLLGAVLRSLSAQQARQSGQEEDRHIQ